MTQPRTLCPHCRRPASMCVCPAISPMAHRTGVTVVQHPSERDHAFNTARLAGMALSGARVLVAWADRSGRLVCDVELPPDAAVLFPSPEAEDLASLPAHRRPSHLVVLDGTWSQAKSLYRHNPWLQALPHVSLSPAAPSGYLVRREPAPHCLSTVESIAAALRILEPDTPGLDGLLAGFEALNQGQVQHAGGGARPRRRQRSTQPGGNLHLLTHGWEQVVAVCVEAVRRPSGLALVHVAALRPATGEVFHTALEGLEHDVAVRLGVPAGPTARPESCGIREFLGPDDVIVTWRARDVAAFAAGRRVVDLKSTWCNHNAGPTGGLEPLAARLALESAGEGSLLPSATVEVPGRPGSRLAATVTVARSLQQGASDRIG